MRTINLLTFHTGISEHRFDYGNTRNIIQLLSKNYIVNHIECNSNFIYKDVNITHGSFIIFEFQDNGDFYTYDFGDSPNITEQLIYKPGFVRASVGQYNPKYWDSIISNTELRNRIVPSVYPETNWLFGYNNYNMIKQFRNNNYNELSDKLLWRGSLYTNHPNKKYSNTRRLIEYLQNEECTIINRNPTDFVTYINEAISSRLILCFGGGGGVDCGDICFRDIEMFGIGIPIIRPLYQVEFYDKLIPDYHYISVDIDIEADYRYSNDVKFSRLIYDKFKNVVNDREYLEYISLNAKKWYDSNCGINTGNLILNALKI